MLAAKSPPDRSKRTRGRVLLIDDEPQFRQSTLSLLRAAGFDCESVDRPSTALSALARRDFDVLVTDLVMGGRAQLTFLEQLAARPDAPGVIVVTAYPTIESAIAAVDLGLFAYLPKPFEPHQLVKRIENAIDRRRADELLAKAESSLRQASDALESLTRVSLSGTAPAHDGRPVAVGLVAEQMQTLTPRERQIVEELMQGYRLSTIARRLEISTHTVRRHLKNIFLKLEVNSQAELLEKLKP